MKSFKHHYYRVVGSKLFSYEDLETYTTEIEAIPNSPTITPLSEGPNDLRALTPAHFLIEDTFTTLPNRNITDVPVGRLSKPECIQYIKQYFLKRCSKEYLRQVDVRSKLWIKKPCDIKIGKMVLLNEYNISPFHWPLGRVTEIFAGDDGIVRVIEVKTPSGVYERSIARVAL